MTEPDRVDPYKLYTRAEAAEFLRITTAWLTELTNTEQVHSIKIGRRRLYPRAALTAYIRGERFETGVHAEDTSTWPPTPSMFATVPDELDELDDDDDGDE